MENKKRNWFTESNRWKHFLLAIPVGFVFSILCVLGCASGMEFKDVAYHKMDWKAFDWLDWIATMLGGLVGQAMQVGIALLIHYDV